MNELIVNVTQEHIDAGIVSDCGRCPIALATGGYVGEWVYCHPDGRWAILSESAIELIARFDHRLTVAPCPLTLLLRAATPDTAARAADAVRTRATAMMAAADVAMAVAELQV